MKLSIFVAYSVVEDEVDDGIQETFV